MRYTHRSPIVAFALGVACVSTANAQVVTDDFDTDTSANYAIVANGVTASTFAFDYSSMGIPPAPNSAAGTTLGLKLEANMGPTGTSSAITLHTNQSFTGDRIIRFDAWVNANGPFPGGGGGSTEFITGGVGGDGVTVNQGGATGLGAWFATTGEGGSTRDFRAYKDSGEQFPASTQFCAGSHASATNGSDPYYARFGGVDVGNLPVQGANNGGPAQQTGITRAGAIGFGWHAFEVRVNADGGSTGGPLVTWSIDGLAIAQIDSGIGSAFTSDGAATIGYADTFTSVSDNAMLSFGLIDNLRIAQPAPAALQLTELVVTPTAAEFVEIFNPTSSIVDLTDYYLTDATFAGGSVYYWQLTTGGGGGGGFGDFYSRFPAGASIAPGEYQTIAMASGAVGFNTSYGFNPAYELVDTDPAVPDMLEATPGSINGQGGLTNGGEMCVLLHWDGFSDLVTDCDYAVWGDKVEAVDKTGVTVGTSTYLADTPIASQETIAGSSGSSHANGSWQRQTNSEGLETSSGGNGADGSDETSENTAFTWVDAAATPGGPAVGAVTLVMQPDTAVGPVTIDVAGGTPNGVAVLGLTVVPGSVPLPFCPGESLRLGLSAGFFIGFTLDGAGALNVVVPNAPRCGATIHAQVFDALACRVSNVVITVLSPGSCRDRRVVASATPARSCSR